MDDLRDSSDVLLDYFEAGVSLAEVKLKKLEWIADRLDRESSVGSVPSHQFESAMWDVEIAKAELLKSKTLSKVAQEMPEKVTIGG